MIKEDFLRLADKVNDGSATDTELNLYNQYFNRFQRLENWDEASMGDEKERGNQIYTVILNRTTAPEVPVLQLNRMWKRIASIAAVFLVVAGLVLWLNKSEKQLPKQELVARTNKALVTNDLIQLPDGSTVILSSGSKLEYAPSFEGKPVREVFLTGKAFFDVRHLKNQPFIVRTGAVYTQVLGTAFDVDSRVDALTVTVVRGKVVVNKGEETLGTLTPNKQIVYKLAEKEVVMNDTDAEQTLAWKEKDLVFNDVTLQHAVALLEERYNVKISVVDDNLARQHFTTTLFESQSLAESLALICDFNNATYTYDKIAKQVTIKPKN